MVFRRATAEDLEAVRSKSAKEYDKLPPPEQAEESIVGVDENGVPRIVMKAERVAEVYMCMDHEWESPAMRWAVIEQGHREMQERLKAKGYTVAYCFFAEGVPNGYIRRLVMMGWNRIIERCIRYAAR